MKAGEFLKSEGVKSVRPGYALEPGCYKQVIGSVPPRDLRAGMLAPEDALTRCPEIGV